MNFWNYKNNILHFRGKNLAELTASYSAPTYYYDLSLIQERALQYKKAFSSATQRCEFFYAMKANSYSGVMKTLLDAKFGIDVVSGGEIKKALAEGFLPQQILYSGVGKTKNEIKFALELGLYQINVESLPELVRIGQLSQEMNKSVSVGIRVNPDVDVKTHPYIATGFKDNKFGIPEKDLSEVLEILKKFPLVKLKALSLHIGSQILDFSPVKEAVQKILQLIDTLESQNIKIERLDVGGGLGVYYDKDQPEKEQEKLAEYAQTILGTVKNRDFVLQFEPGRWLVAHSGFLLSQVQYIKDNGFKKFAILDVGMNGLIRPSLYNSYHEIYPLQKRESQEVYDFVGPICESGDFLAKSRNTSELKEDDWVMIADSGAYGFSMANQYNSYTLPDQKVL
jgi:diaminopimelate decarboxylase